MENPEGYAPEVSSRANHGVQAAGLKGVQGRRRGERGRVEWKLNTYAPEFSSRARHGVERDKGRRAVERRKAE